MVSLFLEVPAAAWELDGESGTKAVLVEKADSQTTALRWNPPHEWNLSASPFRADGSPLFQSTMG